MQLWSINGNSQKLDGGAMFGNAPKAMWSRWIAPDELNRIPLACRCLLVKDLDGRNVLFETGIGAFFEPSLRERYGVVESHHVLLESLAAAGVSHEDIDVVVLSHLHFDHAGGLLAAWEEGKTPQLAVSQCALSGRCQSLAARVEAASARSRVVCSGAAAICCCRAAGWNWWLASIRRRWGRRCASIFQKAIRPGLMLAECRGRSFLRRPDSRPALGASAHHDGL